MGAARRRPAHAAGRALGRATAPGRVHQLPPLRPSGATDASCQRPLAPLHGGVTPGASGRLLGGLQNAHRARSLHPRQLLGEPSALRLPPSADIASTSASRIASVCAAKAMLGTAGV